MMVHATTVASEHELHQILDLQKQNLKQFLGETEKQEQGFVTMSFTIPMLKALHEMAPSVIVKNDRNELLAYAIVFLQEGRAFYPEMEPIFRNFERVNWKEKIFSSYNYYIMGQICVAKEARGTGAFDMLYQKHKELYQQKYDCVVTEIATSNHRSLNAHKRVGFQTLSTHTDEYDEWNVVVWDWS
ncbi:MAG: GNAT family N-acetyltransferase [Chitinophagaceae bacterium]|nr:GNAT family N-acetyltransferase [Chitinophagaceae bacterium]